MTKKFFEMTSKEMSKFEIVSKDNGVADVFLYGEIVSDSYGGEYGVSEKDIVNALKGIPRTVSQINLRVNSPGGSVFSGTTIYELLKNHPAKVTAYVEGFAASIASIIIMAADEIVMGDAAVIMIHKPLVGIYGNANTLQDMIEILDKIEYQMINIYKKRMDSSKEEIAQMLSKETYFTSEEAIKAGLADRITSSEDESRYFAACFVNNLRNTKQFKNLPTLESMEDIAARNRKAELMELTKDIL
jgi:ATP-dependent Clp endopeptidase proteolytic subunit ClpP